MTGENFEKVRIAITTDDELPEGLEQSMIVTFSLYPTQRKKKQKNNYLIRKLLDI